VERTGHNSVGRIKSFFDTIAVVDVDVDVEDALLVTQQFDDTQDNVCWVG